MVDDPKVQRLPPILFRAWVNLLCIAKRNGGVLPGSDDLAYGLRITRVRVEEFVKELRLVGLIDKRQDGAFEMHNWGGRQFHSDVSTDRVKRFRETHRNVSETAGETHQIQNRTDTEQNREEKHTYGQFENVRLAESEYRNLCTKFGEVGTQQRINTLSVYVASKGKKYRSHYATILAWEQKNKGSYGEQRQETYESREQAKVRRNGEAARAALERMHGSVGDGPGSGDHPTEGDSLSAPVERLIRSAN